MFLHYKRSVEHNHPVLAPPSLQHHHLPESVSQEYDSNASRFLLEILYAIQNCISLRTL